MQITRPEDSKDTVPAGSRRLLSRGLTTATVATVGLCAASWLFASSSLTRGTLLTMLPFASALAIAALGQTLVVMQGGIDLSVAGGLSLYVVILTHYPNGENSRLLPAIGIAFLAAIAAGSVNGFLIGRMRLNPIVATLGTNALLYGAVLWYTGGIPRTTTARLARLGGGLWLGIPIPVYVAVVATAAVAAVVKLTPTGRRFEGVGANGTAALTAGIRVRRHRTGAYIWAQMLYCLAALLHAGIVNQPTAYEGDNYLLPSVAAVVLGGTSLLGGRGNLVATAVAALFLSQLDQFVLALGVTYATRELVQAAALAVGVALYTIDWGALVRSLRSRRRASLAPT
jgi:ribose transport system permease protein